MAKTPAKKPASKSEVYQSIADATGVAKKQVAAVMDAMVEEMKKALSNRGPGVFVIPGMVKIEKKKIPARPAQKGVKNPFTGELQDRPAKPASVKPKVRALKALKDIVKGSA
jgi:nucleoid DNA-binding protein